MPNPWDSDHGLSRTELGICLTRAIAARRYEGAPRFGEDLSAEWFDQGWDCDVFRVVDEDGRVWLCKLPKRENVQPWIRKEASLLDMFEHQGLTFAPRLGLRGSAGELPYEWIGISFLSGDPLLRHLGDVDPRKLGASYGAVLREVHRLVPDAVGPRPETVVPRLDSLLENADRALGALRRHSTPQLCRDVEAMVARVSGHEPEETPVVFLHADLFPEHVFLDLAESRVTGLIDWADAAWGDPASDFCLLGWLLGDPFLDAALGAYGGAGSAGGGGRVGDVDPARSDLDAMRRRAVRRGMMVGIYDIAEAEKGAPNVPLDQRIAVLEARAAEGWLERS